MDKIYNYKGCSIKLNNLTNFLTDNQCIRFCFKYLSAYLAESISYYSGYTYTPIEIMEGRDIVVDIRDEGPLLRIYLNNVLHIEINLFGFHNAQMCCECNHDNHAAFFAYLHMYKVDGFNVINI
jgi:hypothetical protein